MLPSIGRGKRINLLLYDGVIYNKDLTFCRGGGSEFIITGDNAPHFCPRVGEYQKGAERISPRRD
jgi:hypothetical protein